jgi:hypothetical protein
LANESPTIAIELTFSRSTVSRSSSMSRLRDSRVTVDPPSESMMSCV